VDKIVFDFTASGCDAIKMPRRIIWRKTGEAIENKG
jgi:hypothetical protein